MKKSIIVVEDEPNIAESLTFILSRAGFDVHCVNDGDHAMFEIRNRHPDLVILDVMLPNRSGLEILRDIRQSTGIKKTPVLMLSAKGQSKDREIAADSGADHYLVKPFANSDVLDLAVEMTSQ